MRRKIKDVLRAAVSKQYRAFSLIALGCGFLLVGGLLPIAEVLVWLFSGIGILVILAGAYLIWSVY